MVEKLSIKIESILRNLENQYYAIIAWQGGSSHQRKSPVKEQLSKMAFDHFSSPEIVAAAAFVKQDFNTLGRAQQ